MGGRNTDPGIFDRIPAPFIFSNLRSWNLVFSFLIIRPLWRLAAPVFVDFLSPETPLSRKVEQEKVAFLKSEVGGLRRN